LHAVVDGEALMSPLLGAPALFNLLSNVCKFTAKGAVTLDLRRSPPPAGMR
jgi:hypothetical protein